MFDHVASEEGEEEGEHATIEEEETVVGDELLRERAGCAELEDEISSNSGDGQEAAKY